MTKLEIMNLLDSIEAIRKKVQVLEGEAYARTQHQNYSEEATAFIKEANTIVAQATTKLIKLETKMVKAMRKAD